MRPSLRRPLLAAFLVATLCGVAAPAMAAPAAPPDPGGGVPAAAPAAPAPAPLIQLPTIDPVAMAKTVFLDAMVTVVGAMDDALNAAIGGVVNQSGPMNFIVNTPPGQTYELPLLGSIWSSVRLAADAGLVLLLALGGIAVMSGKQLAMPYPDILVMFQRMVAAAVGINASLWLGGVFIRLNNALCQAIGPQLPSWDQTVGAHPTLPDVLSRLAYLITALFLILQQLMRLALLDVLLAVFPLVIACWTLPHLQGFVRQWSTLFFGTLFAQVLQVIALKLGAALIAGMATGMMEMFLGIAVLLLVLRLPHYMGGYSGNGVAAAVLTAGVLRSGAGAVGGAVGGVSQAAMGAAARRVRGTAAAGGTAAPARQVRP